ncbi:MAG: hypothetical protein B7X92_10375 [Novosphingobium sp. 17-62-9]|nr:MAG: hypothetical protein B7X92_10375 [Novosphingobium sp. 17-62-9]
MTAPKFTEQEHEAFVQQKRQARMAKVDQFDPETRTLIHHYGLNVVNAFVQVGVTKPKHIRHLVECVLDEFSPTRGSYSAQGIRTPVIEGKRA